MEAAAAGGAGRASVLCRSVSRSLRLAVGCEGVGDTAGGVGAASAGTAGDYPRERFDGHARELRTALADPGAEPALRNLAPRLARAALLEP